MTEETPQTAEVSEQQIVAQMKELEELTNMKGWKTLEAVLRVQLATRYQALRTLLGDVDGPDAMVRVARQEAVKGAIIGIELCLSLPRDTIAHGKQILAERKKAAGKEPSDE